MSYETWHTLTWLFWLLFIALAWYQAFGRKRP